MDKGKSYSMSHSLPAIVIGISDEPSYSGRREGMWVQGRPLTTVFTDRVSSPKIERMS